MSNPPPPIPQVGQPEWGEQLNTYLEWVGSYAASNDARVSALEDNGEKLFTAAPWQFSNQAPPATGNQVRLNNGDPQQATLIDFRKIDVEGADRTPWLQILTVGSQIRIQDWDNSAVYHRYKVTGGATIATDNVQIPVVWEEGSGIIPNAKANVGFLAVL